MTGPIHWRASEGNAPNWNVGEFPVVTLSEPLGPPSKIPTDGGPNPFRFNRGDDHLAVSSPGGMTSYEWGMTTGTSTTARTYF